MSDEDKKKLLKECYKEAMKEFLEHEKGKFYKGVGQWFIGTIATALALASLYFVLKMNGWTHIDAVQINTQ